MYEKIFPPNYFRKKYLNSTKKQSTKKLPAPTLKFKINEKICT